MFEGAVSWANSIGVSGFKSCSRMRNCGSLIIGVLKIGCREGRRQYANCSSAALLPRDLRKSRTARNPRTFQFCRTRLPNSYPCRSDMGTRVEEPANQAALSFLLAVKRGLLYDERSD